jgi:type I restriction enzyme S subunit
VSYRWAEHRLGDVCAIASDFVDPRDAAYCDLPHVGGANMKSGTDVLIDVKSASEESLISGKFAFNNDVVLYSKIRPYLRKVARPKFHGLCSADIYPLTPHTGRIIRDYLYYLLTTEDFTAYAEQGSARSGMPKVNREHLFDFPVRLPSLVEQRRIVAVLDEAFKEIAALQFKVEASLSGARLVGRTALRTILDRGGAGWAEVALGDIATVASGVGFPEALQGQTDGVLAFFKVGDMNTLGNEHEMIHSRHTVSEDTQRSLNARVFPVGSVIFPKVGGAIATDKKRMVGRPCCVDNNVMGIIPRPGRLDSSLLHQLLHNKPLTDFSNDAGLPSIRKTTVEAWRVRLPDDLLAQRELAERLEEIGSGVQELIGVYERKLAALAALKQSLLARAFSGELTREPMAA